MDSLTSPWQRIRHWPLWQYRPTLIGRALLLVLALLLVNALLWILAAGILSHKVLGLALLAWTTGLRHALDADHITAIDNTVRRIMSGASADGSGDSDEDEAEEGDHPKKGPTAKWLLGLLGKKDPKRASLRGSSEKTNAQWEGENGVRSAPVYHEDPEDAIMPHINDEVAASRPKASISDQEQPDEKDEKDMTDAYDEEGDACNHGTSPDEAENGKAPAPPRPLPTPITTGTFFSLGHSTIVIAVIIAVAISASVADHLGKASDVGNVIGTSVSGGLLMILCMINLCILVFSIRRLQKLQARIRSARGGDVEAENGVLEWHPRGCMTALAWPLLKATDRTWKMYPIGVLFGIGFDTSSTIAVISVSAIAAVDAPAQHNASVVLFAFLFTSGMCLVDTLDSIMMVYVYAPSELSNRFVLWERRWQPPSLRERDLSPADHALGQKGTEESKEVGAGHDPQRSLEASDEEKTDGKKGMGAYPDTPGVMPALSEEGGAQGRPAQLDRRPLLFMLAPATQLQLLMTSMSIMLAFAIGLIQILSLIGSQCSQCSAAADKQEKDGNGGLAGRWWLAWQRAADNLTYIGAGIAGVFFIVLIVALTTRGFIMWRNRQQAHKENTELRLEGAHAVSAETPSEPTGTLAKRDLPPPPPPPPF